MCAIEIGHLAVHVFWSLFFHTIQIWWWWWRAICATEKHRVKSYKSHYTNRLPRHIRIHNKYSCKKCPSRLQTLSSNRFHGATVVGCCCYCGFYATFMFHQYSVWYKVAYTCSECNALVAIPCLFRNVKMLEQICFPNISSIYLLRVTNGPQCKPYCR